MTEIKKKRRIGLSSMVKSVREFIQLEAAGGIVLFAFAMLALVIENSPLHDVYHVILQTTFSMHLNGLGLEKPLLSWINDGLMAIFFFLVGLEIKRELIQGELDTLAKASLPAFAALGGMIAPALIYVAFNWNHPFALRGWAIPTATDIAFSLAILHLLGKRVPVSLKVFLTALAIFDDLGAIIIIAAYAISVFVISRLEQGTLNGGGGGVGGYPSKP